MKRNVREIKCVCERTRRWIRVKLGLFWFRVVSWGGAVGWPVACVYCVLWPVSCDLWPVWSISPVLGVRVRVRVSGELLLKKGEWLLQVVTFWCNSCQWFIRLNCLKWSNCTCTYGIASEQLTTSDTEEASAPLHRKEYTIPSFSIFQTDLEWSIEAYIIVSYIKTHSLIFFLCLFFFFRFTRVT